MENIELYKILIDMGFTEGESKVYLALLTLGESKVGSIIKNSGISRSKVYDILEKLKSKKVVSKIEKMGLLYYQALPPQSLLNVVNDKEDKIKQEKEILQKVLPQFSSLNPKQKLNVVIYEGFDGFKAMINRTIEELTSKDVYLAMGISETTEAMRHYARKVYETQKIKKFKARSIFEEKGVHKIEERRNPWHEIRVLPKGWETPSLFTIYGDTIGIHMGEEENIVSVVIINKQIAQSFKSTFEAMWKISKKV
ncbi:MAG: helix-turn-helix domain-containing protein [Nanoarchaeota archaeon]